MGISIFEKNHSTQIKTNPCAALVLAGGAMSGGAFKVGGLKALNDFLVNRKLTDFNIYVGLSAGAILSIPLAGGISPEEMLASLDGTSRIYSQLSPLDLYAINFEEFFRRPTNFALSYLGYLPGIAYDLLKAFPEINRSRVSQDFSNFLKSPTYSNYEKFAKPLFRTAFGKRTPKALGELLPSGVFNNAPIESYLRRNMKRNRMPNNFRVLKRMTGKSLYMTAMDLDTSENIVFGPDEKNDLTISQAAQASSAIPGFYKPARLKGVDYIDGGVRKTANIDLAIEKGADLVICYNPFRPYNNQVFVEYLREKNLFITRNKRLAEWGLGTVINQVFRTLFHSRLEYGLANLVAQPGFDKDIILIEPGEDDVDFFTMNPLFFWNRGRAARHGFESVTRSVEKHYDDIQRILKKYDMRMSRDFVEMDRKQLELSGRDDPALLEVLESHVSVDRAKKKMGRLRVVRGGKAS